MTRRRKSACLRMISSLVFRSLAGLLLADEAIDPL
jgi:hypothetical protein